MIYTIASWSTCRKLVVAALAIVFTCAVIVALVLAARPRRNAAELQGSGNDRLASQASASGPASSTPPTHSPTLPALPRTDDPAMYAREVADALFTVNPTTVSRAEFLQFWDREMPTVVYSDGAAKRLTLAVQNTDAIDNLTRSWIPSQTAWANEAAQHTTNQLHISSVSVPDYWTEEVAAGTFRDPGLHMERVLGVLTQTYGMAQQHTISRSVVIDLGLLCGPTQPGGCRLLAPQQAPGTGDTAS